MGARRPGSNEFRMRLKQLAYRPGIATNHRIHGRLKHSSGGIFLLQRFEVSCEFIEAREVMFPGEVDRASALE